MSCPEVPELRVPRCFHAAVALLVAVLAACGFATTAAAVEVTAVRFFSAPDHTRIVADLSGPAAYRHLTLEDPSRIVVDVDDVRFAMPLDAIPVNDGIVKQIRFGPPAKPGAAGRLVLDLEQTTRYDVFLLEKVEDKPDRLVVDVRRVPGIIPVPGTAQDGPKPRAERRIGPDTVGDFLILVDPGHGGDDHGRRNPDGLKEKHLALDFSKALAAEIDRHPGFRAALTRTGDYFVPLGKRRAIAEEKGAHLFVSIHFNAAPSSKARGTEIFFVSMKGADDRATRELEDAENSADLVGGLPPTDQGTSQDIARMLVDLRQSDSVERSQQLSVHINDQVAKVRGVRTRPVKQAGFAVLKQLFIPATLVEVAFLSNREDAKWARSKGNRDAFVRAMADGIVAYCEEVELPRLGWRTHVVNRGESLANIAATYGMDMESLRAANGIDGDKLKPGQKLRVKRS
jgi:N-acetylmuramoyl-L-alanine amidase